MILLRRAATLAVPLAIAGLTLAGCERPEPKPSKLFGEKVRAYLLEHNVAMKARDNVDESFHPSLGTPQLVEFAPKQPAGLEEKVHEIA